jgi:lactoylglutathione lyase
MSSSAVSAFIRGVVAGVISACIRGSLLFETCTRRTIMRLEHVAVWTRDLERLRTFYERYFDARANARYESVNRPGFTSYFLTFPAGGGRLELMSVPDLSDSGAADGPVVGYAHLALAVGSRDAVDALTARLRADGARVRSAPRVTGDGYYEAVVEDPDGNELEITAS